MEDARCVLTSPCVLIEGCHKSQVVVAADRYPRLNWNLWASWIKPSLFSGSIAFAEFCRPYSCLARETRTMRSWTHLR